MKSIMNSKKLAVGEITEEYIDKRIDELLARREDERKGPNRGKLNRVDVIEDAIDFVRERVQSGEPFTRRDMCNACHLSYESTRDYNKVYSIILKWRKKAIKMADDPKIVRLRENCETVEKGWDAFIDFLNERDTFLLHTDWDGRQSFYYQPGWVEKKKIDLDRIKRQLKGPKTVILEINKYGELPELADSIKNALDEAEFELSGLIDNKIKELTSPME